MKTKLSIVFALIFIALMIGLTSCQGDSSDEPAASTDSTSDTGTDTDSTSDTGTDTDSTSDTGTDTDSTSDTGTDTDSTSDTGTDTDSISDTTSPSSPLISIDSGASSTSSNSVALTLSATDDTGVISYYVSEISTTPLATDSGWVSVTASTSYSADVSYTLSSGDGTKTVYVWFKDSAGNVSSVVSDSITLFIGPPIPIPDTGQTGDYTSIFGEDSDYTSNTFSFTDNGDSTVKDNNTSLVWQKEDDNSTRNWSNAKIYCESLNFGGYTDWRLPNVKELQSIVNYGNFPPTIDQTYFPNTASSYYWSSTTSQSNTDDAWLVTFGYGSVLKYGKVYNYYVRCVRGRSESAIWSMAFSIIDSEIVSHLSTSLMWQREDDSVWRTWESALSYCESLSLGGYTDWRLPNVKELQSIVNYGNFPPTIDQTYFPNTASSYYWSSTTNLNSDVNAWGVYLYNGMVGHIFKTSTNSYYVRCVRGGQ